MQYTKNGGRRGLPITPICGNFRVLYYWCPKNKFLFTEITHKKSDSSKKGTVAFHYPPNSEPYEHPLVVPQSSHTVQLPLRFTRIELQLEHCSPV